MVSSLCGVFQPTPSPPPPTPTTTTTARPSKGGKASSKTSKGVSQVVSFFNIKTRMNKVCSGEHTFCEEKYKERLHREEFFCRFNNKWLVSLYSKHGNGDCSTTVYVSRVKLYCHNLLSVEHLMPGTVVSSTHRGSIHNFLSLEAF